MNLRIPTKIMVGFVLAVIISAGAGVLLYQAGMQFRGNRRNVQRAHEGARRGAGFIHPHLEATQNATRT